MEELINYAIDKGGVILLLVIIVVALWIQFTRNSVSKDSYNHLLKRVDAIDDDLNSGVIPSLKQLTEAQKLTQETLSQMRHTQELSILVGQKQLPSQHPPASGVNEKLIVNGAETKKQDIIKLLNKYSESDLDQIIKKLTQDNDE